MMAISVADSGSGAFLIPGYGMGKKSGTGICDLHPRSFFHELRNRFLG